MSWNYEVTLPVMLARRYHRFMAGLYIQPPWIEKLIRRILLFLLLVSVLGVVISRAEDTKSMLLALFLGLLGAFIVNISMKASTILFLTYLICWLILTIVTGEVNALFDPESSHQTLSIILWCVIISVTLLYIGVVYVAEYLYPALVLSGAVPLSHYQVERGPGSNQLSYLSKFRRCERKRVITYEGSVDKEGRPHGVGEWTEYSSHGECLVGCWDHGIPVAPFRSQEIGTGFSFAAVRIAIVGNRIEGLYSTKMIPEFDPSGLWYAVASIECSVSGKFFKHLPNFTLLGDGQVVRGGEGGMAWVLRHMISPLDEAMKSKTFENSLLISANEGNQGEASSPSLCNFPSSPSLWGITVRPRGYHPLDGATWSKITVEAKVPSPREERRDQNGHGRGEAEEEEEEEVAEAISVQPPLSPLSLLRKSLLSEVDRMSSCGTEICRSMGRMLLRIEGWNYDAQHAREALIFFHGFNSPASKAAELLAQLLTLGDFPFYLVPIVFSWPGGNLLTYTAAQTRGCDPERNQETFSSMLKDLRACGIRRVHFLAHSMGARLLANVLKCLESCCVPVDDSRGGCSDSPLLQLETVTFVSPEINVDEFVPRGGVYDVLRKYTDCITLYGDQKDFALLAAFFFNGMRVSAGREINAFCRAKAPVEEEDSSGDVERDGGGGGGSSRSSSSKEFLCPSASLEERLCVVSGNEMMHAFPEEVHDVVRSEKEETYPELGKERGASYECRSDHLLLDMDIIETTWLEANVHSIRHSFFNINTLLIDDIREVIEHKRRACHRLRTIRKGTNTNIFVFMSAPTVVVNP